jgi:hypothetical protein
MADEPTTLTALIEAQAKALGDRPFQKSILKGEGVGPDTRDRESHKD